MRRNVTDIFDRRVFRRFQGILSLQPSIASALIRLHWLFYPSRAEQSPDSSSPV